MSVTFPELLRLQDLALLLVRLIVALEFGASGYYHLKDPAGRSKRCGSTSSTVSPYIWINRR